MKLNFRTYQQNQTKSTLKKNKFLLFTLGANQNSTNWIAIEQNLHKLDLTYNKIYNNITTKVLKDSIAKKIKDTIHSTFFFLTHKSTTKVIKSSILNEISASKFNIVALKLNKKLYATPQLKKLSTFHYKKNVAILYQFLSTTLKATHSFKVKNS
jgi:hypothetical protein